MNFPLVRYRNWLCGKSLILPKNIYFAKQIKFRRNKATSVLTDAALISSINEQQNEICLTDEELTGTCVYGKISSNYTKLLEGVRVRRKRATERGEELRAWRSEPIHL